MHLHYSLNFFLYLAFLVSISNWSIQNYLEPTEGYRLVSTVSVLQFVKNSNKPHVTKIRIMRIMNQAREPVKKKKYAGGDKKIKKTKKPKKTGLYHFLTFSNRQAQILSKWLMVKAQEYCLV